MTVQPAKLRELVNGPHAGFETGRALRAAADKIERYKEFLEPLESPELEHWLATGERTPDVVEVGRLRAENERLREALRPFAEGKWVPVRPPEARWSVGPEQSAARAAHPMPRSLYANRGDGLLKRMRRRWSALFCAHSRTVRFYPDAEVALWARDGHQKGPHAHIVFEGCLGCGYVAVRDYGE